MDFLFAMSVFSSAADGAYEKGKAQEWMRAWVDRDDGGAASLRGKPRPRQDEPPASQGRKEEWLQRRRRGFAPEFDGLNCFETFVDH